MSSGGDWITYSQSVHLYSQPPANTEVMVSSQPFLRLSVEQISPRFSSPVFGKWVPKQKYIQQKPISLERDWSRPPKSGLAKTWMNPVACTEKSSPVLDLKYGTRGPETFPSGAQLSSITISEISSRIANAEERGSRANKVAAMVGIEYIMLDIVDS
jgi:hypothetical protein